RARRPSHADAPGADHGRGLAVRESSKLPAGMRPPHGTLASASTGMDGTGIEPPVPPAMARRLDAAGLGDIAAKLAARERLSFDEGVRLFEAPDLLAVGWLANRERERRHGARTYFNHNLRLEATNVCEASCLFCSFARLRPTDPGAHTMSVEQVLDKLRQRAHEPLTEIHIVNGLHPGLPFDYYKDLLRGLKRIRPDVHLKCFTAVEIAFFADLYGLSDEQVLVELREAGLDSLPGGGAEIFAPRVRRKICHDKCDGDRYLAIHRTAHRLGMRTNVTML